MYLGVLFARLVRPWSLGGVGGEMTRERESQYVWLLERGAAVKCPACDIRLKDWSNGGFRAYKCEFCNRRYTMFDLVILVPGTVPVGRVEARAR